MGSRNGAEENALNALNSRGGGDAEGNRPGQRNCRKRSRSRSGTRPEEACVLPTEVGPAVGNQAAAPTAQVASVQERKRMRRRRYRLTEIQILEPFAVLLRQVAARVFFIFF